mgnify:CR=1 FL=1
MVPLVLNGEIDEVTAYLPECRDFAVEVRDRLAAEYDALAAVWRKGQGIESQKDFARVAVFGTKLSGILFALRKEHGAEHPEERLRERWLASADLILKALWDV